MHFFYFFEFKTSPESRLYSSPTAAPDWFRESIFPVTHRCVIENTSLWPRTTGREAAWYLQQLTVKQQSKDCSRSERSGGGQYLVSRGTLLPSTQLSCSGALSGGVVCSSAGDWPAVGAGLPVGGARCREELRVWPAWCAVLREWLRAVTEGCWR